MGAFWNSWREDFTAALTFLTRLPAPAAATGEMAPETSLARTAWAFPLVGIVVGAAGGIAYIIAQGIGLPPLAAALIAVGTAVLVTGGLHEDGFADMADGFGGGATREDKLEIMRDSRTGAYGVLALVFSVGLRVAALAQIATGWRVLGALIAAHALARGAMPIAMRALDPARADGLGASAGRPEQDVVIWSGGIAIVAAVLCAGFRAGLLAAIVTAGAMVLVSWLAQRQIGGYTGDVLGAIEQASEIVALLSIAAWAS